jgi:hypothetical protein
MTQCKWPKCIEEGCTPLSRQFQSCFDKRPYDPPCTQEDRDRISDAAQKRVLACELEFMRFDVPHLEAQTLLNAAAQLRQLAEGK